MKIVDADMWRDGGTTSISFEEDGMVKYATFEFALPWDGRPRYVYLSDRQFGMNEADRLAVNSPEETHIIEGIRAATVEEFGRQIVDAAVANHATNPSEGLWFYVFNFLKIAASERDAA